MKGIEEKLLYIYIKISKQNLEFLRDDIIGLEEYREGMRKGSLMYIVFQIKFCNVVICQGNYIMIIYYVYIIYRYIY